MAKIVDISKYAKEQARLQNLGAMEEETEDISSKTAKEYLDEGFTHFASELDENTTGFLAVAFTSEGDPSVTWAGEVDPFVAIGVLEIVKKMFTERITG